MNPVSNTVYRCRVLLSAQRALLGQITPEIRAVDVSWNDREIFVTLIVCHEDAGLTETANAIEVEMEASFVPAAIVRSQVVFLPSGPIPLQEVLNGQCDRVFARWEGD